MRVLEGGVCVCVCVCTYIVCVYVHTLIDRVGMVLHSPLTEHELQHGACLAPTNGMGLVGQDTNSSVDLGLVKGCACIVIALHCALFGRRRGQLCCP